MYDHLKEMKPKGINPNSDLEVETLIAGISFVRGESGPIALLTKSDMF